MLAQGPPECWAAGGSSSPHFPGIELEPSLPLARRPVAQVFFWAGFVEEWPGRVAVIVPVLPYSACWRLELLARCGSRDTLLWLIPIGLRTRGEGAGDSE